MTSVNSLAIIPAAGSATRMRGLPKFLLPCDEQHTTLLERQVNSSLDTHDKVVLPVHPENQYLLGKLGLSDEVEVIPMETKTMSETVLVAADLFGSERYSVFMPDTFFSGGMPHQSLSECQKPVCVATWNVRKEQIGKVGQVKTDQFGRITAVRDKDKDCEFPLLWGAVSFSKNLLKHLDPESPHVGYLIQEYVELGQEVFCIKVEGSYYDCGTPAEYFQCLNDMHSG